MIIASPHIKRQLTVVKTLKIFESKIPGLFFVKAKNTHSTFIATPGNNTNFNQTKSFPLKLAPNISENNFGKKNPNKELDATDNPSKKTNIYRSENFFIKELS